MTPQALANAMKQQDRGGRVVKGLFRIGQISAPTSALEPKK